jgi:hypothetical protein
MLGVTQYIVLGHSVSVESGVTFDGDWVLVARAPMWPTTDPVLEARSPADGDVLAFGLVGWEAPEGELIGSLLALIGPGNDGRTGRGPKVVALAETEPRLRFFGECGGSWSAAVAEVAGTSDPHAVSELLLAARGEFAGDDGNPALRAIDLALGDGTPTQDG